MHSGGGNHLHNPCNCCLSVHSHNAGAHGVAGSRLYLPLLRTCTSLCQPTIPIFILRFLRYGIPDHRHPLHNWLYSRSGNHSFPTEQDQVHIRHAETSQDMFLAKRLPFCCFNRSLRHFNWNDGHKRICNFHVDHQPNRAVCDLQLASNYCCGGIDVMDSWSTAVIFWLSLPVYRSILVLQLIQIQRSGVQSFRWELLYQFRAHLPTFWYHRIRFFPGILPIITQLHAAVLIRKTRGMLHRVLLLPQVCL